MIYRGVLNFRLFLLVAFIPLYISNSISAKAADTSNRKIKQCYDCHADLKQKYTKKYIHDPVKKNDCESCHDRHGFANNLVLKKQGAELCYSCHSKEEKSFQLAHIHKPVTDGNCLACHDPHASQEPSLLKKKNGKELCLTCHQAEKVEFERKNVHQ